MKRWFLFAAVAIGLTWSGGSAFAEEPLLEELQILQDQYEALKTQSLGLLEMVRVLKEERQRIIASEKALQEALEEAKRDKADMEDQYVKLLGTVRDIQEDRRRLVSDQTIAQKMVAALKSRVEAMERRQADLESSLKKSEESSRSSQFQLKDAANKIDRTQKALITAEQANVDLQLQVAELQSLSRESRIAFNYELGLLYARHGEYKNAVSEFQKTLALDPTYANSYRALGEIYREHLRRADLASPYFRRYLELRPEAGDFEQIKGWMIKTKKEIDTRRDAKQWEGGGFFHTLGAIFY